MKKFKLFLFAAMLLGSVGLHAGTQITYTATAILPGYEGRLNKGATTFGPAIVSHEFSNGTGTITCSGEITTIGYDAFYKCSGLTSITIPNSVTTIGISAFEECTGLTSIEIPNSVTTIGNDAFQYCSGLASVTIGNSVTTIGDYAFRYCSGLTSVTIGNSVKTIGISAFDHCSSLTSITIPNSVTTIGNYAFEDCSVLTSITIPNSVTTIGNNAFYDCTGLTSVTIGNSVTTIGKYAFSGCTGLTSVAIPHSVTTIGDHAFYLCSDLTSVTIGNSVTTIGDYAFYACFGLTSVTVFWTDEKSIPSINSNVFGRIAHDSGPAEAELHVPNGTAALYQQTDVWNDFGSMIDDVKIYKITYTASAILPGYHGTLDVGSTTFGPKITSHTFSNGTGTIICDGEITTIGNEAFSGCSSLTSITIPNSVTTIGKDAFEDCSGLTSVTIGNSVTTIGNYAFYHCTGLTSITIPNSVTTIGKGAFYLCSRLTSVTIGNSVATIESDAFYRCGGLTVVTINSNAICSKKYTSFSTIGNIFGSQVKEYIIGNSVTTIGDYAFYACFGLTSVTIPNSVTTIGNYAFKSCGGLTSVTIPNSVTTIGSSAFYACSGLTSITIPNSVTSIGTSAFYACSGLTSITIPNSVTSIGTSAFRDCTGLTSVTIPNSVTTIGDDAFYYCKGLTSIEIPNSVTKIGNEVFHVCTGLTSVTVSWTDEKSIPSINSNVFEGIAHGAGPNRAKLHVPKGTKELYQQADGWKEFGDIESDIIKINNLWYRLLNVRTVNLIVNQDTTATGERIPYSGDAVIPNTVIYYGNNSISAIEDSVFYNAKLTSLTVLTDIPLPCEQYTFLGQDKSIPVYVLDVDAFKRAQYWNKFTNIQFYAPYRDEAKQKLIDAANSVPNEHNAEAKAIAEAYGKKMDGLNTAAAIDKLYAQAMEEIQAFMDEALWTLDKTGCMTLPKP